MSLSLDSDVKQKAYQIIPNVSKYVTQILRQQLDLADDLPILEKELNDLKLLEEALAIRIENKKKDITDKLEKKRKEEEEQLEKEQATLFHVEKLYNSVKAKLLELTTIEEVKANLDNKDWLYNLRLKYLEKNNERITGVMWNKFIEEISNAQI